MANLALTTAAVFALTFLAAPRLGGGWSWDLGNGLGFLALAGLLVQMAPGRGRGWLGGHERLGTAVLATAALHGFWPLLGDGAVRVYLMPGAPAYMWLGLAGLLALAALVLSARMPDRARLRLDPRAFRRLHRGLADAAALGALAHIALSGFYARSPAQVALLATLALVFRHWSTKRPRGMGAPVASLPAFLAIGAAAVALFALIRNLPA